MKLSQIRHLRAQLDAELEELARGQDVAVSSTLLAGGRIRIVPDLALDRDAASSHGQAMVKGNGHLPG